MKKRNIAMLALSGLCAVLFIAACPAAPESRPVTGGQQSMNPPMQSFYNSLSSDSKRKFDDLDTMHKQRAMDMGGDPNKAVDNQYNSQKNGNIPASSAPAVQ